MSQNTLVYKPVKSLLIMRPSLVSPIAVKLVERQGINVEACGTGEPLTSGGPLNVTVPYGPMCWNL